MPSSFVLCLSDQASNGPVIGASGFCILVWEFVSFLIFWVLIVLWIFICWFQCRYYLDCAKFGSFF